MIIFRIQGLNLLTRPNVILKKGRKLTEPEKLKLSELLYGLVIPLIVGIVIIAFPAVLRPLLDTWFPAGNPITGEGASDLAYITVILTHGFASMIIFGIPLLFGLVWNKWAGGGVGFITGSIYYVAFAAYNTWWTLLTFGKSVEMGGLGAQTGIDFTVNLFTDPSFIGNYIVCSILLGYIVGALNNRSTSFKRMLGASLTATISMGVIQFVLNMTVASGAWMAQANPGFALFTVMLPMVLLGVIVPIIAKVMSWYGLAPMRQY